MESRVIPPDSASARQTEMGDAFNRVLFSALDAMENSGIPYALIGGIAASGHGRPRSTHDIDIFVRPEDADASLEALSAAGFETEQTDKRWLYKGWKEEMMVDVIFKSHGDIYFDDEMHRHAKRIPYHGHLIPVVSPEDLMIIKAAVHSEIGPHHWHDALAILSHAHVDWNYLVRRARRAPRRILALLIYAQSNDILIPNHPILELTHLVFGEALTHHPKSKAVPTHVAQVSSVPSPPKEQTKPVCDVYLAAHVNEALACDPRTAALDVQIDIDTGGAQRISVRGEASSHEQRQAIEHVIRELAEGYAIENQVRLTDFAMAESSEVL